MEWSRAKTILILAFLALNLFLVYQLLQARYEQFQNNQSITTRGELKQLIDDRNITMNTEIPEGTPKIRDLEVKPTSFEEAWTKGRNDLWIRKFDPPVTITEDREGKLASYVKNFDQYVLNSVESTEKRQVYDQYFGQRRLFDGKIIASWKKERKLTSIQQAHFSISNPKGSERMGISASTSLLNLIEKGKIKQGETITDIRLGYKGQPYDKNTWILHPVWRIQVEDKTIYFVNAFNGSLLPSS